MILLLSILLAFFVLEEPWNWVVLIVGAILEVAETTLFVWWSKRAWKPSGAVSAATTATSSGRMAFSASAARSDGGPPSATRLVT